MPSSTRRTRRCSAAAGWTAPSTGRADRRSWPSAASCGPPATRTACPPGQAVATTAGRLPCRWVIHTVGPTWAKTKDKSATLRSCYLTSLDVAAELGAASVAFPLISAGVYRWPKDDAVRQAFDAVAQSPHTGYRDRAGAVRRGHPATRPAARRRLSGASGVIPPVPSATVGRMRRCRGGRGLLDRLGGRRRRWRRRADRSVVRRDLDQPAGDPESLRRCRCAPRARWCCSPSCCFSGLAVLIPQSPRGARRGVARAHRACCSPRPGAISLPAPGATNNWLVLPTSSCCCRRCCSRSAARWLSARARTVSTSRPVRSVSVSPVGAQRLGADGGDPALRRCGKQARYSEVGAGRMPCSQSSWVCSTQNAQNPTIRLHSSQKIMCRPPMTSPKTAAATAIPMAMLV